MPGNIESMLKKQLYCCSNHYFQLAESDLYNPVMCEASSVVSAR